MSCQHRPVVDRRRDRRNLYRVRTQRRRPVETTQLGKNGKTVETTEPRLAYYGYVVEDPKDWSEKQLR